MTQTYTTRHNCIRAARTALQKDGVAEPMTMVHFNVAGADGAYTWSRIDQDAPAASANDPAAALALLTAQPPVTVCPTAAAEGVRAPRQAPARLKVGATLEAEEPATPAPAEAAAPKRKRREPAAPKGDSKKDTVLALLRREGGATLQELIAATGWLPHTTRAFLSVQPRKMGLALAKAKVDGRGTVYSID